MTIQTIHTSRVTKGMRVLVRADLDVAMERGRVVEPFRLESNISTLRYVINSGARVRIIGHLGRPNGSRRASLSLRPVIQVLERLLHKRITLVADPLTAKSFARFNMSRDIIAFENIRYWPGEEANDPMFAKKISRWGDVYINEAFAASHRSHASLVGISRYIPSVAGFHLEKEIIGLERLARNVRRPLVAVIGGGKSSTKMPIIKRFLKDADYVLLGGGLANTFLYYRGFEVGRSIADRDGHNPIKASSSKRKLFLPKDVVTALSLKSRHVSRIVPAQGVRKKEFIVDVGPKTILEYRDILLRAKTVVWNGPLGFAEIPAFSASTKAVARIISGLASYTVIGGGDTIAILKKYRLLKNFSHISTGGGAMLEFLAGKKLPAIRVLEK